LLRTLERRVRYLKHFWKILSLKERYFLIVLGTLFLVSSFFSLNLLWRSQTKELPEYGGTYREGIVGSPRFINPLLAPTNDADRDLTQLVFSGLMRYTSGGVPSADLAQTIEIKDGGKVYEFTLRDNITWHDGTPVGAEDIAFTIKLVQDPEYRSPLRINWQGVEVNILDEKRIQLILKTPYAPFLETTTMGILPKHIWEDVTSQSFSLAPMNLKPIGNGPYQLKKFKKDRFGEIKEIWLVVDENYHLGRPLIANLVFKFFAGEEDMVTAYKQREIDGLASVSPEHLKTIKEEKRLAPKEIFIPRYFAVFFNQTQSKPLSDINVRVALATALDRDEIIQNVLEGKGVAADSPIPKGMKAYSENIIHYPFSPDEARAVLDRASWKDTNGDGVREKGEEKLEFTLVTTASQGLDRAAELLKNQWGEIGANVNVEIINVGELQNDFIRPRNYQALLFGEILGQEPDPFSFWHSSQKRDPGLNLSLYENKTVDKLLEEARQTPNDEERIKKYAEFQNIITRDLPAIFLYSPSYIYPISKNLKGVEVTGVVDPSKRFSEVEKWYLETRRVWK